MLTYWPLSVCTVHRKGKTSSPKTKQKNKHKAVRVQCRNITCTC